MNEKWKQLAALESERLKMLPSERDAIDTKIASLRKELNAVDCRLCCVGIHHDTFPKFCEACNKRLSSQMTNAINTGIPAAKLLRG